MVVNVKGFVSAVAGPGAGSGWSPGSVFVRRVDFVFSADADEHARILTGPGLGPDAEADLQGPMMED